MTKKDKAGVFLTTIYKEVDYEVDKEKKSPKLSFTDQQRILFFGAIKFLQSLFIQNYHFLAIAHIYPLPVNFN